MWHSQVLGSNFAEIKLHVSYQVRLTRFEKNLADLGLIFQSLVSVVGVDGSAQQELVSFPTRTLDIAAGDDSLSINVYDDMVRPRSMLVEDVIGDDEIRCYIRFRTIGMPRELTGGFVSNTLSLQKLPFGSATQSEVEGP
jgi:hypothetical protein